MSVKQGESSLLKAGEERGFLEQLSSFKANLGQLPAIQFASLRVPLERRVQTLCIFFSYSVTLLSVLLCATIVWMGLWPLLILYFAVIRFDNGCEFAGRPIQWVRRWALWRGTAAYFPMRMVLEVELDPEKQYMFGYHPHGVIANGAVIGFGTEALGVSELFPRISIRVLTINLNFVIPFYREISYALGFCLPTKKSINNIFKRGHSCVIAVGGAEEALHSAPNTANLVMSTRKGFIAMAIKNGASLVPVYAFGENECFDVYTPEKGSIIHRSQQSLKKLLGFTIPLYYGRTVFTYNYGFLPKRHPINIVVGKPIHTTKEESPSPELVTQIHQEYMTALKDLYDRNKHQYCQSETIPELNFNQLTMHHLHIAIHHF